MSNYIPNSAYTCSSCGFYVPAGTIHNCSGWVASAVQNTAPLILNLDPRIIVALEKIASVLERLVEWEVPKQDQDDVSF